MRWLFGVCTRNGFGSPARDKLTRFLCGLARVAALYLERYGRDHLAQLFMALDELTRPERDCLVNLYGRSD